MSARRRFGGLGQERSASVISIFALTLPVLIGAAALATDVGSAYVVGRDLQAATDAAAMAAVSHPEKAEEMARRVLDANGFAAATFTVELGRHVGDAVPHEAGRLLIGQGSDSVRIRSRYTMKTYLAPIFSVNELVLAGRADAAIQPTIAISGGSRLASANPALVNALLKPLTGVELNLTLADYTHLLHSKIGLGELLKSLSEAAVKSGTPGSSRAVADVLKNVATASALFHELSLAMDLGGDPVAAAILRKLGQRTAGVKLGVTLADTIEIDTPIAQLSIDYPHQDLSVDLPLLDVVNAVLDRRDAGDVLDLELPVPGLASVRLEMMVGEGEQVVKPIAVTRSVPKIRSDQLRLRARIATAGALDIVGVGLDIPLEVVVAGGTAEVVSATCASDPAKRSVKLRVQPGVAKLAIGTWSGPLSSAGVNDKLPPANLVRLLAVKILAQGYVAVRQATPIDVIFTGAEIERGTTKTVKTRTIAKSLVGSLLEDTEVTISAGIIGLPLGGLTKGVAGVLAGLLQPLDDILLAVTGVTGIGIGEMDVRVDDIVCSRPEIVG